MVPARAPYGTRPVGSWLGLSGTREVFRRCLYDARACLLPDILRYDSPKKCPTILYAVNLWLKPVSATGTRTRGQFLKESTHSTRPGPIRDPACGVLTWLVGDPGGVPPVPLRCPSLLTPRYFTIRQSKEMSHDFIRGKSVAETCFSHWD